MRYSFHPEAEKELLDGIDYYENCEYGLGHDFAVEVYSALNRIIEFPEAWPSLTNNIRRCQTRRFPYGIVYSIEQSDISIIAVMHLHREPDYWNNRY